MLESSVVFIFWRRAGKTDTVYESFNFWIGIKSKKYQSSSTTGSSRDVKMAVSQLPWMAEVAAD